MSIVYGVLVVCGACLAAVLGLALVQRLVPATIREEHNDVAGFIYAALGVIDAIRATIQGYEPRTVAGQELYAEGLDQVQRLADARRMRLVVAEEGLPTVLWVVLIVGGIVAVGFAYLFGLQNTWAHALMV